MILPGVWAAVLGTKRAASTAFGMTEILAGGMQARSAVFCLLQWETQITCTQLVSRSCGVRLVVSFGHAKVLS